MFDLELPGLTDQRGQAVAEECERLGAWPVTFVPERVEKRWFGVEKFYPPVLEVPASDGTRAALAPGAARDADTIAMNPKATDALAATVSVIADHFPEGFVFRATWSGSPIQRDEVVAVNDLASLIRRSALNEFTRYTVPPHGEVGGA